MPQELFDIGVAGYLQELRSLVRIIAADSFAELLPLFSNYREFLQSNLQQQFAPDLLAALVNEDNTIYLDCLPAIGERLFSCANLAAACETFNGWTIPAGRLTVENCGEVLRDNILVSGVTEQRLGEIMGIRLNRSDAVRVAQIIKLLGLLSPDASKYDQLALGASMARRDREGFHCIPGIGPEHPGAEFSRAANLNFAVQSCEPNSLAIIDNDKNLQQDFERINRTEGSSIQALNLDLYAGLDSLATAIEQGDGRRRNLVTMFRLEPRALPDITGFLDKLSRVVSPDASFLATVGSGDTEPEFVARQAVMDEFGEQLKARGLRPLRIILYDQKSQAKGRIKPAFGIAEYASFEILFCNLGAKAAQ